MSSSFLLESLTHIFKIHFKNCHQKNIFQISHSINHFLNGSAKKDIFKIAYLKNTSLKLLSEKIHFLNCSLTNIFLKLSLKKYIFKISLSRKTFSKLLSEKRFFLNWSFIQCIFKIALSKNTFSKWFS